MNNPRHALYAILAAVITVTLAACRPNTVSATLVPDVPTQVFVEEAEQTYNFYALDTPTTLQLVAEPSSLAYLAEVRAADGGLVATLSGGGPLENAGVTVPASSGAYEVRVRTDAGVAGRVELVVRGADEQPANKDSAAPSLTPQGTVTAAVNAGVCQLTASTADIAVYRAPSLDAEALGGLRAGATINAEARAGDTTGRTWYRVRAGEVVGWIPAWTITTIGACDTLTITGGTGGPTAVRVNTVRAPFDADSYTLNVDPAIGANFTEQVSYPEGDATDRLWLAADNVPGERSYTLRLICEGDAASSLRWGTPENPSLGCGGALDTTFSPSTTRRSLLVTMPTGGASGHVAYRLEVDPTAPQDAEAFLFPLTRDGGGRVAEAVSYPNGDTTDRYVARVDDFDARAPHDHRLFQVTLRCDGANADALRWGLGDNAGLDCGGSTLLPLGNDNSQSMLTVTLPQGSARGYVAYVLEAHAIAPSDRDRYDFSVDRNGGGQFGEVVSAPDGDPSDLIIMTAANLTDAPPDNFREYHVTLMCSGNGTEALLWGPSDNPNLRCNEVISVPLMTTANTQAFVVALPEGTSGYVQYTLAARPLLATPTAPPSDGLAG